MGLWSTITQWLTRAPQPPALSGGSVVPAQNVWSALTQFWGNYSPTVVSSIIAAADSGRIKRLVDLVHDIRQKDGHVQGCMTGLELAIGELEWHAEPHKGGARGKARKSDQKLAQQVLLAVSHCAGWAEAITHCAGEGELHGHATVELQWGMYDGPEPLLRGWLVPVKATIVQANRFGFRQSDQSLLFDAGGTGDVNFGGVDLLDTYQPGKFIQHRPRVNGSPPVTEGTDRLIAWYGAFRKGGVRAWLLASENAWQPIKLFQYSKQGTSSEDKDLALALANRMTTHGAAAIPESIKPIIQFPPNAVSGATSSHQLLLEWLGMEVSKAILGHTLLIESGTRGARSLGEVGYKMAEQRRNARALSLAATLNAHLVIPLVRMNAGRKPIPFLLPDIQSEIDLGQFSESVDRLARRMRVPASYVREQAQIPEPQGDEEVLTTGDKPSAILADGTLDIQVDVVEPDDEEEPGSDSPNPPKTAPRRRRGR